MSIPHALLATILQCAPIANFAKEVADARDAGITQSRAIAIVTARAVDPTVANAQLAIISTVYAYPGIGPDQIEAIAEKACEKANTP